MAAIFAPGTNCKKYSLQERMIENSEREKEREREREKKKKRERESERDSVKETEQ